MLSSFNPDVCLALRLKQNHIPVLFITRGGSPSDSGVDHRLDPRHHNVGSAASWAHLMDLQGIVTLGEHFGSDPSNHDASLEMIERTVTDLDKMKLSCYLYGPGVSEHSFRAMASEFGLSGLILDHVDEYMHDYQAIV